MQPTELTTHCMAATDSRPKPWTSPKKCIPEIFTKCIDNQADYLLPIIKDKENERKEYDNALHLVNYHLRDLSRMFQLQCSLTMYVARHSWASTAKAKNVSLSVISEGMGHDSEATTLNIASLEKSVVNKANKMKLGLRYIEICLA